MLRVDYIYEPYGPNASRFHPAGDLDIGFDEQNKAGLQFAFDKGLRFNIENYQSRETNIYGEIAITTGIVEGSYFLPDGTPDDKPLRVTYVWLRQNGRWKEVHHHGSQMVIGS